MDITFTDNFDTCPDCGWDLSLAPVTSFVMGWTPESVRTHCLNPACDRSIKFKVKYTAAELTFDDTPDG
jgi:hypothetical protein